MAASCRTHYRSASVRPTNAKPLSKSDTMTPRIEVRRGEGVGINGRVLIDVGVGRTNGRGAGVSPSCDRYIKLILNRQLKLHSLFISRAEALRR